MPPSLSPSTFTVERISSLSTINLLIADSNQLSRYGLNAIFAEYDNVQLVGEAINEEQMLEMIEAFDPDLVMIDFTAPGFSVDGVRKAKTKKPHLKIVAITPEQSGITIVSALKAGVSGYIKKDCDLGEIAGSVQEVGRGGQFFCGQILQAIRKEAIDLKDIDINEFNCEAVNISDRENEVITMIAEGLTNGKIAEKLFISAHTVNTHRKNIMQKLGVRNTAAIVMYAVKTGLVSPNRFLFAPTAET